MVTSFTLFYQVPYSTAVVFNGGEIAPLGAIL